MQFMNMEAPVHMRFCLFFKIAPAGKPYAFPVENNDLLFISRAVLHGAVPIVFATYPLLAGLEHSQYIFNVVFFISVTSVLFQGTALLWVLR